MRGRRVIMIAATMATFVLLQGCKTFEKDIRKVTNNFLESYFKVDYVTSGSFCSENLAQELSESLKSLDSLEPTVKEMLVKQSKGVKTEIISVDRMESRDSAEVLYKIVLPDFPSGIENRLIFARTDKTWKIVSLGR